MTEQDMTIGELRGIIVSKFAALEKQTSELFELMRQVREDGCVVGRQNRFQIEENRQRCKSLDATLRKMVVMGVLIVTGTGVGAQLIPKLMSMLMP